MRKIGGSLTERKRRRERFQHRVIMLSADRPQYLAYEFAEKLEKKRYGERLYKNYASYRSAMCWHR